jgi:hypothetical protein
MSRKKALVLLILLYFAHISKPENLSSEMEHAAEIITQTSREAYSSRRRLGEILGDTKNPEGRAGRGGKTINGVEIITFQPRDDHFYNVAFQHDDILVSISYDRFFYRKKGVRFETLYRDLIDDLSKFFGRKPAYGTKNEAMWEWPIYDGSIRIIRFQMSSVSVLAFRSHQTFSSLLSEKEHISISLRIDYVTAL